MAAEYRSVHTEMWRADDWFQTLPTDARLLWIYLFTNPSASVSGIYKLPLRTMANETGLDLGRVTELLAEFREAKKAYYQDGVVWVRKMRDYQLPGKISTQLIAHLNKEIAKIPDGYLKREYLIAYGYRIDTHSKPVDTVSIPRATETDTDTDTETETETETPRMPPPPTVSESATFAREQSTRLGRLNAQVAPALRTPLANAILDMTGKRALADAGGAESERVLAAAHEAAVTLYQMGVKSESALLALEPEWRDDWRGCNGGTAKQLLEFVSERQGGKQPSKRSNGNGRNDASRGFGLASLTTDADRAYHASIDDAAIAELQAEFDQHAAERRAREASAMS